MATKDLNNDLMTDEFNRQSAVPSGGYHTASTCVPLAEVVAVAAQGMEYSPPVVLPVKRWMEKFDAKPAGQGALCACCEREFNYSMATYSTRDMPERFVVIYPYDGKAIGTVAVVSAVCSACVDRHVGDDTAIIIEADQRNRGPNNNARVIGTVYGDAGDLSS